ncbi:hypothetical protein TIFTF001_023689 [Ficus carica]|uniref:Ubiquitin-like protease family profile domain-containing protein n=1 Tax=Ficus carica TaxID=3494 RepID=A0AA88DFH5_FICCA|nr:hypothetical protein TIFTF001_023689 [Ficus carica]
MSKLTKMTEKNITPEKRSLRIMASADKMPPAEKSSKKPAPDSNRRRGSRQKSKLRNQRSRKVFYNIVMQMTDHSEIGDALRFETLPSIAAKFTTKYDKAIPGMLSWTTADNVKFDDVMSAFTAVGQKQGKAPTAYYVSNRQKMNVQTDKSDALKTTSNDLGSGSQDDVFIDSDIDVVANMGMQAAMEFLTADKEDVEEEKERPSVECHKGENNKHIDVAFYYLRKKIMQFPELKLPDTFDWGSSDSLLKIILGVYVRCGLSWFEVNTLLIPIHFADLKHWALVKLDLTSWTIEVYDSLQHEGPHNFKVREKVECMSKFIPLADRISLFEFKPREPPGIYPISVTIMKDIPQQANGGDCGMFTIKYADCLIEGRDVRYWVIQGRMQIFREWLTCYLLCHAKRKIEQTYKSDDDEDMDF